MNTLADKYREDIEQVARYIETTSEQMEAMRLAVESTQRTLKKIALERNEWKRRAISLQEELDRLFDSTYGTAWGRFCKVRPSARGWFTEEDKKVSCTLVEWVDAKPPVGGDCYICSGEVYEISEGIFILYTQITDKLDKELACRFKRDES